MNTDSMNLSETKSTNDSKALLIFNALNQQRTVCCEMMQIRKE